jgi:hypothetical protein
MESWAEARADGKQVFSGLQATASSSGTEASSFAIAGTCHRGNLSSADRFLVFGNFVSDEMTAEAYFRNLLICIDREFLLPFTNEPKVADKCAHDAELPAQQR